MKDRKYSDVCAQPGNPAHTKSGEPRMTRMDANEAFQLELRQYPRKSRRKERGEEKRGAQGDYRVFSSLTGTGAEQAWSGRPSHLRFKRATDRLDHGCTRINRIHTDMRRLSASFRPAVAGAARGRLRKRPWPPLQPAWHGHASAQRSGRNAWMRGEMLSGFSSVCIRVHPWFQLASGIPASNTGFHSNPRRTVFLIGPPTRSKLSYPSSKSHFRIRAHSRHSRFHLFSSGGQA